MKYAAGELAVARLRLMDDRARQPARADDAIRRADLFHQIQKRVWWRRAVGVHITDQIAERREPETLDECAALADGRAEFQRAHLGKIRRDFMDDAESVVRAAVEDDEDAELAGIILLEKLRVIAQHRFDARFFVVSRNQDEQAGVRHADSVTENFRAGNLGKMNQASTRHMAEIVFQQLCSSIRFVIYENIKDDIVIVVLGFNFYRTLT